MSGNTGRAIGRGVLGIGGAIIGNAIAPGIGGALGGLAGSFLGSQLLPPELPDSITTGPQLGDLRVQIAGYGRPIPQIFGVERIAGNVIWSTDLIKTEHREVIEQDDGKGGSTPTQTQVSFTYSVSFAVSLGVGPITGVRKVFANKTVVHDPENPALDVPLTFRVYPGSETQLPDPDIEADIGVGMTPAYRGQAYVVFPSLELAPFNNSMPNFTFEVVQGGALIVPSVVASGVSSVDRLQFDPETRLMWLSGQLANKVVIVRGTDMVVQRTLTGVNSALDMEYVPAFIYVTTVLGQPVITEVPATMHIGSDTSAIAGGRVRIIETHTYKRSEYSALPTNHITSPSTPMFFWSSVRLDKPNFIKPVIHVGETTIFVGNVIDLGVFTDNWTNTVNDKIDDWVNQDEFMYVVDFDGVVKKVDDIGVQKWSVQPATSPTSGGNKITYHETLDAVFAVVSNSGGAEFVRLDKDTGATVFKTTYSGRILLDVKYHERIGDLWLFARDVSNNGYLIRVDPADGTQLEELNLDFQPGLGLGHSMLLYPNAPYAFVLGTDSAFRRVPLFEFPNSPTVTVQSIIDFILDSCGIDATLRNTSAASTILVKGYKVANLMSGRQALEPLMRAFLLDMVESDDVLKVVPRGGASVATILEEEMAAKFFGQTADETLSMTRRDEAELPNQVDVLFTDQNDDFNVGTQYERRLVTQAKDKATVSVPVVMTASYARQLAQIFLHNTWLEKDAFKWSTTVKYVGIEPTDIVTLQLNDGRSLRVRVTKTQYTPPGLIQFEGFRDDVSVYTSILNGVSGSIPISTQIIPTPSILQFMDIPILRDRDDDAGFYIGVAGPYSGWKGADLWASANESFLFEFQKTLLKEMTYGFAKTVLPTTTRFSIFNDIDTVDIELINGSISSSTDLAVLNEANAFLIGNEIVQAVNVQDLGSNVFRLSRLIRGRKGTDVNVTTHVLFERFVALNINKIDRVLETVSNVGLGRTYKAVSDGSNLANTFPRFFINNAVGLKPYAGVDVVGTRDGSLNLTITWKRRARVNHHLRDTINVPLDETVEAYEVDILNGSTVVRTIVVSTSTASYTAAEQITDFGSEQSSIDIIVYQISSFTVIGRGFGRPATV